MSFVEWSDTYQTGVPDIDREHKQLFSIINDLHDRVSSGSDGASIKATIAALVDYVNYHFAREEALLETCGYAHIIDHIENHRKLQGDIVSYSKSYSDNPETFDIDDFMRFLANWLKGHILETDMEYVPSIRKFISLTVDAPE